jgi:hypothetical protein
MENETRNIVKTRFFQRSANLSTCFCQATLAQRKEILFLLTSEYNLVKMHAKWGAISKVLPLSELIEFATAAKQFLHTHNLCILYEILYFYPHCIAVCEHSFHIEKAVLSFSTNSPPAIALSEMFFHTEKAVCNFSTNSHNSNSPES